MKIEQLESKKRSKEDRPWKKDAPPLNKKSTNPDYPTKKFDYNEWSKSSKKMEEDSSEIPEIGDAIRTKKMQMEGKVEKIGQNHAGYDEVFFRIGDGRLMKTPMDNVIVIQKLADEDQDIFEERTDELSTELLAKYKAAAGKDASAADKSGDYERGNKRFSGIVKATNKQFDNDKKKHIKELDMSGMGGGIKPPINKEPPGDHWGNNDDGDEPHPTDYLYLAKSYAEMIDLMVSELNTKTGSYTKPTPEDIAHVKALYNDKTKIHKMIDLFDNSGIGAGLKIFLTLDPESQQFFRFAWEDHGIDVDGDLRKFNLNENIAGADDNFTPADIKRLETINDIPTLKAQAKELIKGKAAKRMKTDKIAFFYDKVDGMTKRMAIIKLMYDLLLAGEGNAVVGSRNSMKSNSYRDRFGEGSMGGINRSAPSNDVSYEKVLDEVYGKWHEEQINELSVGKLQAYKDASKSPDAFRSRPLRKLAKTVQGVNRANQKIDTKTGNRRPGPGPERSNNESVNNTNEVYLGPHLGDPEKLAKAPKSYMQGKNNIRFSELVQDTIQAHGVKDAFDFYVRKHGLPPRQFQIYAGLTVSPKAKDTAKPDLTSPSKATKSKPQSWWQKLKDKLPFEE